MAAVNSAGPDSGPSQRRKRAHARRYVRWDCGRATSVSEKRSENSAAALVDHHQVAGLDAARAHPDIVRSEPDGSPGRTTFPAGEARRSREEPALASAKKSPCCSPSEQTAAAVVGPTSVLAV